MTFEQAVRKMSEETGIGIREASRRMGRVPTYLNALLSRGSNPRIDTLLEIAEAFGYRVSLVSDGGGEIELDNSGELPDRPE